MSPTIASEDASVINRIIVWKGGCGIIADNWLHGVGIDKVGKIYASHYQRHERYGAYYNLLNDGLTLGAAYGIFALILYVSLSILIIAAGIKCWKFHGDYWCLGASSCYMTFFTCGIFNTLLSVSGVCWIPFLSAIIIVFKSMNHDIYPKAKIIALAICASFIISSIIFGYGCFVNSSMKYNVYENGDVTIYVPKEENSHLSICFCNKISDFFHLKYIIPLVDAGYHVEWLQKIYSPKIKDGNWPFSVQPDKAIVIGIGGLNAIYALKTGIEGKALNTVICDVPLEHPFAELSFVKIIMDSESPVIAFIDSASSDFPEFKSIEANNELFKVEEYETSDTNFLSKIMEMAEQVSAN